MDSLKSQETLKIQGDINFTRVLGIRKVGEEKILSSKRVSFDFSDVSRCDSSALVLLIAWKRFAKASGAEIEFLHLPQSLMSLADMCNIKSIIDL